MIILQGPILLIWAGMGPGHESNLTLQPWDTRDIPFLTLMWSQELWKKKKKWGEKTKPRYKLIAYYRTSPSCPICTSVIFPQHTIIHLTRSGPKRTSIYWSWPSTVYRAEFKVSILVRKVGGGLWCSHLRGYLTSQGNDSILPRSLTYAPGPLTHTILCLCGQI